MQLSTFQYSFVRVNLVQYSLVDVVYLVWCPPNDWIECRPWTPTLWVWIPHGDAGGHHNGDGGHHAGDGSHHVGDVDDHHDGGGPPGGADDTDNADVAGQLH